MSKIICDICGTTYPDTAQCCPICGCSRDDAAALLGNDELLTEEIADEPKLHGGRFTPKKHKEIFDFDEVNTPRAAPAPKQEESYEEEPEEEEPKHNTGAVILLTALIAVLLLAAGFLFVRFFLPNMMGGKEQENTEPQSVVSEETAGEEIPCQNLVLLSGEAKLYKEGGLHAINVFAQPEDTTDKIIFRSADESVATVDETGLVTAVGQGITEIHITCGDQEEICPVTCTFEEEATEETEAETEAEGEGGEAEVPEEGAAEEPTEATTAPVNPDIKLKLRKSDISLGVHLQFQLLLNCKLEQNAVQWSSEHPNIASVDAEGNVTALKKGTTSITAKYGDQEVSCIVRCR